MNDFNYHKPTSLGEAAQLLSHDYAKLLAGGMTLLPTVKQRLAQPGCLVDLSAVAELSGDKNSARGRFADNRCACASRRSRRQRFRARINSGFVAFGGFHRRPAGAESGDNRRISRQQRPGGGLSGGGLGIGGDGRHQQTRNFRRRFFCRNVHNRPRRR